MAAANAPTSAYCVYSEIRPDEATPRSIVLDTLAPKGERFTVMMAGSALQRHWGQPPALQGWEVGPAEARIHIQRATTGGAQLAGTLQFGFVARCRRCLQRLPVQLDATHVEAHFVVVDPETMDHGLHRSDLEVVPFDGRQIDVVDWLAEEAALHLPEHPLCHDGCRGLCPQCGADLNDGDCGCAPPIDPRWAKLKNLLE